MPPRQSPGGSIADEVVVDRDEPDEADVKPDQEVGQEVEEQQPAPDPQNDDSQEVPGVVYGRTNNSINSIDFPPPPALAKEAYHGFIGEFLDFAGPRTEAPDACILAHLLPAIGTAIGPEIHSFAGDEQPARVFTLVVGTTSLGRKGTGLVPVNGLMRLTVPTLWEAYPLSGLSSGEGLIVRVSDHDEKGKRKEDEGEEVVVEKRVYVVESEFSKVLVSMGRDGSVLSQIIRQAYDGSTLSTLTVKPRTATGAHISITGHITPDEVDRRFTSIEMVNGFGNRFLWFYSLSDKVLPEAEPLPQKQLQQLAKKLREVLVFVKRKVGSGHKRVDLDDSAKEKWNDLYPVLRQEQPGFVGALAARGTTHIRRLALLYALLDKSDVIKPVHLNAALAVWYYAVDSLLIIFAKKNKENAATEAKAKEEPLEDKLYKILVEHGPMLQKDFYAHIKTKGLDLNPALEKMENNGLIRLVETKRTGPGRSGKTWEAVKVEEKAPAPEGVGS